MMVVQESHVTLLGSGVVELALLAFESWLLSIQEICKLVANLPVACN